MNIKQRSAAAYAVALFVLAVPAHAAIIDEVKADVTAIRKQTTTIQSQTTSITAQVKGIDTKVKVVTSQARAQLAQLEQFQALLDKLKLMKEKFAEAGIDLSADVLDQIDLDSIKTRLEEIKGARKDLQGMLNDPGLEDFRAELMKVLAGIRELVEEEDGFPDSTLTPLQSFIEKAPRPVIAVLKASSETDFLPLVESVSSAREALADVRELIPLTDAELCQTIQDVGISRIWSALYKQQQTLLEFKRLHLKTGPKVRRGLKKFIPQIPDIGIHGYLTLRLSGIDAADIYGELDGELTQRIDLVSERAALRTSKIEWIGE